ncbi:MAG TPA: hypothetical protein VFA41_19710 [Ktedonobacteraceae bacterium]|jgi:hypothetical protein|nr:hypothetical protein [Ktedonobacteraceae bacterium]
MRFSLRSKAGGLFLLLALIALISGFAVSGSLFRAPFTRASGVNAGVTKGQLTPVAVVNPTSLTFTPDTPGTNLPKGARHLHTRPAPAGKVPGITSTPIVTTTPGLLQNFNGVSSLDSEKTNFGAEFEPPDQGLCVGNGFVVEPVNSAYTIYRNNGTVVAGPFNVNKLYAEGFKQFTSDPRCYYDPATHTWFAIILFINSTNTRAHTDIAVNPSGDPTTPWMVYRIDATDDGTNGTPNHPGCPCFGDQPRLGIDQYNLYISTDEFSITGPAFNGTQLYAVSKAELVALAKHVHFVHFDNLSIGGTIAFGVQPAISRGHPDAEYFMNSLDPNGTFDNRLGVWAMTNRDQVTQGGLPTLSNIVITSEPYGVPPGAEQKGASSLLDAGDDRMQQVQFINGNLWGELDTAVTIPNDTAERAGAAWFDVNPHLQSNGTIIGGASIVKQGYVASAGNYLLYPAIQASPDGTAAMVMTLSGSNYYPSVVYTLMGAQQNHFGAIHIAANGTGPYDPTATRWGDYSWAILSPDGQSFWMATEYIPPKSSQTTDGLRNWGTRVIQVSAQN